MLKHLVVAAFPVQLMPSHYAPPPALGYPTITAPGMGTPLAAFQAPNPNELLAKLQRANVDIKVKWNQTRVSPSVYNNDDDIDALLNAVM